MRPRRGETVVQTTGASVSPAKSTSGKRPLPSGLPAIWLGFLIDAWWSKRSPAFTVKRSFVKVSER